MNLLTRFVQVRTSRSELLHPVVPRTRVKRHEKLQCHPRSLGHSATRGPWATVPPEVPCWATVPPEVPGHSATEVPGPQCHPSPWATVATRGPWATVPPYSGLPPEVPGPSATEPCPWVPPEVPGPQCHPSPWAQCHPRSLGHSATEVGPQCHSLGHPPRPWPQCHPRSLGHSATRGPWATVPPEVPGPQCHPRSLGHSATRGPWATVPPEVLGHSATEVPGPQCPEVPGPTVPPEVPGPQCHPRSTPWATVPPSPWATVPPRSLGSATRGPREPARRVRGSGSAITKEDRLRGNNYFVSTRKRFQDAAFAFRASRVAQEQDSLRSLVPLGVAASRPFPPARTAVARVTKSLQGPRGSSICRRHDQHDETGCIVPGVKVRGRATCSAPPRLRPGPLMIRLVEGGAGALRNARGVPRRDPGHSRRGRGSGSTCRYW
ncbi:hypothetical protein C7M84_008410 [Penaeus vannamei]|uniref:Uncharacterized protein n=1 Tax=Penaeus vannamei TaxID=6689 RepID=A0A423T9W4_PENVA|nr:hypothetical protein C7M84_008410 [Penaeus vannamei]